MSDIVGHPWMLGETATHEAVWNEFALRKKRNIKQKYKEFQEREAAKILTKGKKNNKKSDNGEEKVYLSWENSANEETEDYEGDSLRMMENFEENDFLTSILLSAKSPRGVVNALAAELKKRGVEIELHATKWKLTYTIKI